MTITSFNKTDQSDRAPNPNEKPATCYCSALPKGSGPCLPYAIASGQALSEAVICALLRDFSKHGEKAITKVRRTQLAAYLKILALLVHRVHKVEHSDQGPEGRAARAGDSGDP